MHCCTGDLKVHLDTPTELAAMHAFGVFLLNMRQNVHLSTHRQGHILDVVVSSEYCTITGLSIHPLRTALWDASI